MRVLRAFRFQAVTGFEFSEDLKQVIEKFISLAMNPAKERIMYEIMKLFGGNFASKSLLMMDDYGLLEKIFPNVVEMKKVTPNTHHHLDLFQIYIYPLS